MNYICPNCNYSEDREPDLVLLCPNCDNETMTSAKILKALNKKRTPKQEQKYQIKLLTTYLEIGGTSKKWIDRQIALIRELVRKNETKHSK